MAKASDRACWAVIRGKKAIGKAPKIGSQIRTLNMIVWIDMRSNTSKVFQNRYHMDWPGISLVK